MYLVSSSAIYKAKVRTGRFSSSPNAGLRHHIYAILFIRENYIILFSVSQIEFEDTDFAVFRDFVDEFKENNYQPHTSWKEKFVGDQISTAN